MNSAKPVEKNDVKPVESTEETATQPETPAELTNTADRSLAAWEAQVKQPSVLDDGVEQQVRSVVIVSVKNSSVVEIQYMLRCGFGLKFENFKNTKTVRNFLLFLTL